MMKYLIIDPLGPLSLSKHGVAETTRFSSPISVAYAPQPITVLGLLGNILGIKVEDSVCKDDPIAASTTVEGISKICNCSGQILLGPLITFSEAPDNIYSNVYGKLASVYGKDIAIVKDRAYPYYFVNCGDGYTCAYYLAKVIAATALERRAGIPKGPKIVKQGFLFEYPLMTYKALNGSTLTPRYIYIMPCEEVKLDTVARVGGEQRLAKVTVTDYPKLNDLIKRLYNPLGGLDPGHYLAVSYIPIIPKVSNTSSLSIENFSGLEFLSDVRDIVGIIPDHQHGSIPKIKVERLGLGFSEACKTRRPQILALPPGTLIRINSKVNPVKPYSQTINLLWRIGYTTLIKLP